MRLNTIFKLTSVLGLAGFVKCGYRTTFFGETAADRPSITAIPACGIDGVDLDTPYFIAMNHEQYDETKKNPANPNTATICGKCIKVMFKDKWVVGKVVDRCPKCPYNGLDVSPAIFNVLSHESVGVIAADWEYTDCSKLGHKGTCSGGKCTTTTSTGDDEKPKSKESKSTTSKTKTSTTTKKSSTKSKSKSKSTTKKSKPTTESEKPETKVDDEVVNEGTDGQVEVDHVTDKEEEGTHVSAVVSLFGFSAAAGIALIYAKRTNRLDDLKEKFPEAFSNIKRSISRGSTQIRRGLSQSGRAISRGSSQLRRSLSQSGRYISRGSSQLRRSLSQSGRAISRGSSQLRRSLSNSKVFKHSNENVTEYARSKREYRNSLNAHYPLNNNYQASSYGQQNYTAPVRQYDEQGYNTPAHQIYYNENYYDDNYYDDRYYNDGYYNNYNYKNNYDNTNYEENPYVYQFNAYDELKDVQTDFVDTNRK